MTKRIAFSVLLSIFLLTGINAQQRLTELPKDNFNILLATDLGRNGYYDQKTIATEMGNLAQEIDMEFVVASGDTHHYEGIASIDDPLWMTNYELVYQHPELLIEWYPILGNHEYRGNTQAVIDYSKKSRRWCMPARYYTKVYTLENGQTIRFIYIDTVPLIDKYRNDTETYPDAVKQDMQAQLNWIESTLNESKSDTWTIIIGHHPIYAQTSKDGGERSDMQKRVDTILKKHKVDMYICGHIHNFQHIRMAGSDIDYVVNTSGSLSRKVSPIEGTVFCSPESGFSVLSASDKELTLYMLNAKREVLHTIRRVKK